MKNKTKRLGAWGSKLVKKKQVCLYCLLSPKLLSLIIRMPCTLFVQGGYLSHGRHISCFQGDKGHSILFCTDCFSSNFNSKQPISQSSTYSVSLHRTFDIIYHFSYCWSCGCVVVILHFSFPVLCKILRSKTFSNMCCHLNIFFDEVPVHMFSLFQLEYQSSFISLVACLLKFSRGILSWL